MAVGSADEGTGVISPRIRSTNAEDAIPPGSRVHWTCRNASGTSAFASGVESMTIGTRNATRSDKSCVRSTASFHSRLK